MSVETQEPGVVEGFDFEITDPLAIVALNHYNHDIAAIDDEYIAALIAKCGLSETEARTAITHRLIRRAAALASYTAIVHLNRPPDPERWRSVTGSVFREVSRVYRCLFADYVPKNAAAGEQTNG
ncbi:MAG TPA: hypothetical protein DEQ40_00450 [Oxalobacteraceae bacterium]|nr:hypothetical protein [Oxalobacteraceae bacterium]